MVNLKDIQAKIRNRNTGSVRSTSGNKSTASGKTLEDIKRKAAASIAQGVDDKYIQSYLTDSQKYFTQAKSDIDGLSWESATNTDMINNRKKSGADLLSRSNKIRAYLNVHRDSMDEDTYNSWMAQLDSDKKSYSSIAGYFDSAYDNYSQYEGQQHYDIYHMSLDEIQAKIDSSADAPSQADVQAAENRSKTVNGRSRNLQASNERTASEGRSRDHQAETQQKPDSKIAYTTKSGQNITWQDIYDQKLDAQTFNADYTEYSSRANWDEFSQELSNPYLLDSDWQLMYSITTSSVPYRWEDAKEQGYTEGQWKKAKDKRDYIAEKYNLDLSTKEKATTVLQEKMDALYSKEGELANFDHIDMLTDEERGVLYYIANVQGRKAALNWFNKRKHIYDERARTDMAQRYQGIGEEHPLFGSVLSVGTNLAAGGETLVDGISYLFTGEMDHNESAVITNSLRSGAMQAVDWEIGNWDAYDFLYGTGMSMADSVVSRAFGPTGGAISQGLGAAGHATNDALDRGMSSKQAFWTGVAAGTAEAVFEKYSISKFDALKEVPAYTVKDIAKNIGKSMLTNASEEALTEIANITYDVLMNGEFSQWDTAYRQYLANGYSHEEALGKTFGDNFWQVVEAGASGALMGFGFGAAGSAGSVVDSARANRQYNRQTRAIAERTAGNEANVKAMLGTANDLLEGSTGRLKSRLEKRIGKVQDNATAKNAQKLYKTMDAAAKAQNRADIVKSLKIKGISNTQAGRIADAIIAMSERNAITENDLGIISNEVIDVVYGGDLSKRDRSDLEAKGVPGAIEAVINEFINNDGSTVNQRSRKLGTLQRSIVANHLVQEGVEQATAEKLADIVVAAENGQKLPVAAQEVLDSLQQNSKLSEAIRRAKDAVNLTAEEAFDNLEKDYSGSNSVIANMPKEQKNAFLHLFDENENTSGGEFAHAMAAAYALGYNNRSIANLDALVDGPILKTLTKEQRMYAWEAGREVAEKDDNKAQENVEATYQKAQEVLKQNGQDQDREYHAVKAKGVNKLNDQQQAAFDLADNIAPAVKADIVCYRGGKEWGFYDHSSDKIHINVNAKWSRSSMMVYTLSHELVHRAKKGSPKQFKAFADFLMEQYGKQGSDVDEMIGQQMDAADAFDRTVPEDQRINMTPEMALEEVICDACQRMLLDTNAGEKLAQWGAQSQQNKGFLAKLKKIITDLLNRLRSYFKNVDPESLSAKEFAKFDAKVKRTLAKMFVDMNIDAGEKLSTIKAAGMSIKNTATEGKISYALGKEYWYPQMTKAEIAEVKDIAQNEANKTDNYLGIDDKWLYNNQKGHRYFALYSTAREEITLLYACKDDRAEFEHDLLKDIIEEDGLNESIDTGSATIGKILSRVTNANNRQAANRSGTVGSASNSGNAAVHSRYRGKRASKAFINCLQNIKKVQSRYGVDDHYLFAVDRGDYATAQRMVDEAADAAGFTTSGYHGSHTPGFTVVDKYSWLWLARDKFVANKYGTNTEVDNSSKPHDKKGVYAMRYNLGNNLVVYADGNSWGELPVTEDEYPGVYADEDTGDITTNAMAEWAEKNGYDSITFVDVMDGGGSPTTVDVVFNPNRDAKSADPVTYDDDGNVIPLSERFNPAKKDIRYKLSVADSKFRGDFDYSGLNWAKDLGIITSKDTAIFERTINNEILRGAKPNSANGEYIIDTGKCLMFTDGDFHAPTLSRVVVFETEYESLTADTKELIYKDAKVTGDLQESLALIEETFGPGFASAYDARDYRTDGRQNGRGKGNNSSQPYRRNRPRSVKEILAQQGITNFKLPVGDSSHQRQAGKETLTRYQEALRGQREDTRIMEQEFARLARAFETQARRSGKKDVAIDDLKAALKAEAKKHRNDQKLWEAEFNRLLRAYEASGRKIDRLEAQVAHQRQAAQAKVENRRKTEMRHKIIRFKEKLQNTLQRPTENSYVPVDLISAMVDVCELIDNDSPLYKADGSLNKAQAARDATRDRLLALKDEYSKLKTNSDPIYQGEFDEMIETYLDELRQEFTGKSLKDMTLDELQIMYEILRSVDETLLDARKLIDFGEKADVYEAGDSIIDEQRGITQSRKNGRRNKADRLRDTSLNYTLSPMRNVERMSGYHGDSFLLRLFKKFEQGIRKKNKFMMDAYQLFEKLTSAKAYDQAMYTEVGGKKYEDVNGRKFGISKMQMMQAILSFERELVNGHNHIQKGGFTFADLDKLKKGKLGEAITEEYAHRVPAATDLINEFMEILQGDDWCQQYMAAARSFFNGMAKDAINETSIAWKHRAVAQEKNYIPYEVDKNFVMNEISAANNIQETINAYGMLKATQNKAPQPLIITGLNNILDRHIEKVGSVYGLAIPVRNFNKVWNMHSNSIEGNPTVKSVIELNWGKEGIRHIEQAVQDIQGPREKKDSPGMKIYRKVKSNYIGATFLLNLSVVTKQNGSLFAATSMLRWRDPIRMLGNLYYTMGAHKKIAAEVNKYTASAWMRREGVSDAELHTLMTEAKKGWFGRLMGKLPAPLSPGKWIAAQDYMVALSLWRYAKADTAKRTGLKGEELLKATAEFYDDVIENTQSMTDVLHRPEVQKSGDPISDMLGMFKTDLYQMAGQLKTAQGRFAADKTGENARTLGRTVYAVAMSAIWNLLMTTLFALIRYKVNPYRDEEDKDLTAESWLKRQGFALVGDLLGYVFPLLGSEFVGFVENVVYGEREDLADSIALTAINDLYDTMVTIGAKGKSDEAISLTEWRKLGAKALQIMGVPANNILRTWDAMKLHIEDFKNGELGSFEAGVDRTAANHAHRIAEAVDAGNMNTANALYEEAVEDLAGPDATDEEKKEAEAQIKTAIGEKYKDGQITRKIAENFLREIVGENEDGIYWIFDRWDYAIAHNDSQEGYTKYDDFYAAVETGKDLRKTIKVYTDNGVSQKTLKTQITSYFKPIYLQLPKSEKMKMRGYLINAFVACGDTREQAIKKIDKWE